MLNSHTQGLQVLPSQRPLPSTDHIPRIHNIERMHLAKLNSPYQPPTYPVIEMTSFETWAAKQTGGKIGTPKEGWNGVDIKKLLMGKS